MAANKIPRLPIYLDSPMAIDATDVFRRFNREHQLSKGQCDTLCSHVTFVRSAIDSQTLSGNRHPKVIIAGAGMLNGGRILHHLQAFGGDWRNAVVIAGYQSEGTRGHALLNGAKQLRIYGQEIDINCQVAHIGGLSAHADYSEILDWLRPLHAPTETFVTHGELLAADSLRQHLEHKLGWNATVPEHGDEIELF
jgi:metallo-beta-lactamase family protein